MSFEELKSLLSKHSILEVASGQMEGFPKEEFTLFLHHGFRIVLRNTSKQFIELMKAFHQVEESGLYTDYTGIVLKFGPEILFEKRFTEGAIETQGKFLYSAFSDVELPLHFKLTVLDQYADPKPYTHILMNSDLPGIAPIYYWEKI